VRRIFINQTSGARILLLALRRLAENHEFVADKSCGLDFADPNGANLAFAATAGTITIASTIPVPEPATRGLILCALAGLFLMRRRWPAVQ
jgi:hypothetical protein